MRHFCSLLVLVFIALLSRPVRVHGHAGHDHGPTPGAEAAAVGPVTLSDTAIKNLGIQTVEADLAPLQRTLELVGRVQALPERQAKISPRAEGHVIEILVKLGDEVRAGQPLLRFQPLTVGNPQVTLTSPIAGYVARQETNIGQSLKPDYVVMEIADYREVLVRAFMFESPEMSLIEPGQSARVRLDAFPDATFQGKVQRIDVGLEPESRTFEAYVLLENPELKLRPNMLATVSLGLGEPQDALAVPQRALVGDMGNLFVFVQDGNVFERRSVVLGIKAGDRVEVLEGVLPGDKVVVQGNYQLQFATGAKKPAEAAGDPTAGESTARGPAGVLAVLTARSAHLPAWTWALGGFALGGFVFGFLLRRIA